MSSKTHGILQNLKSKTIIYKEIYSSRVLIPLLQEKGTYFHEKMKKKSVSNVYTISVQ